MRDDRSRLRYRLRFGFEYQLTPWSSFGARIRTGLPTKQQDPQLTLGDGFKEFSTRSEAMQLERKLKSFNNRDYLLRWIEENSK